MTTLWGRATVTSVASVIEPDVKTRRWRRLEYERLVDLGMFVGERLELLDGLLAVAADAAYGSVYRSVDILRPPSTVTPLGAPGALIPVADLLPRAEDSLAAVQGDLAGREPRRLYHALRRGQARRPRPYSTSRSRMTSARPSMYSPIFRPSALK